MPAATVATFTGIHNENEFYSPADELDARWGTAGLRSRLAEPTLMLLVNYLRAPIQQARMRGRVRQRASSASGKPETPVDWSWGDEP